MKKLPVAVCLEHEDLDFTLGSTLGRSDNLFLLLLLQLFSQERKEKHNLQKPYSYTSLCSRQFLKRLNAYPDISYVMADQEILAELNCILSVLSIGRLATIISTLCRDLWYKVILPNVTQSTECQRC